MKHYIKTAVSSPVKLFNVNYYKGPLYSSGKRGVYVLLAVENGCLGLCRENGVLCPVDQSSLGPDHRKGLGFRAGWMGSEHCLGALWL